MKYVKLLVLVIILILLGALVYQLSYHKADNTSRAEITGVISYGPTSPLGGFCSSSAANITVLFTDSAGNKYSTTTDSNGRYKVNLPSGGYSVTYENNASDTGRSPLTYPDFSDKGKQGFTVDVSSNGKQSATFNGCFDTGLR